MSRRRRRGRKHRNPKKRILWILIPIIFVIALLAVAVFFFKWKNKGPEPEKLLKTYMSYIEKQDYEKMYEMIDPDSEKKKEFLSRNENIYEGIGASDIQIEIKETKEDGAKRTVSYTTVMQSLGGEISFDNTATFQRDKDRGYVLEWTDSVIFPDLSAEDKVRIYSDEAARGQIVDRNNTVLAGTGQAWSCGLVPGKMNEDASADITKLAGLLGLTEDSIQSSLSQNWVSDDSFVPLSTISMSDETLVDQLLEIPGVKLTATEVRSYPLGASASHLIGYTGSVTAEDLEKHKGEGYTSDSVIGKSGLESLYEKELRGENGYTIAIEDENGEQKSILAYREKKDGKTIKLTIDASLQQSLYDQFREDEGASVAMNPYTGEVLALVSTPSYDNNAFILGISNSEWDALNNDEKKPLYNRFRQTFAPGSTLKPFTAAIGLAEGTINPNESGGSQGTSWQKDESWGSYFVTTLQGYSPVNLENALVYSDNIYFAQAALNLGAEKFTAGLEKFGFNKELPFEIRMTASQYDNDGEITDEIQLADSGYGQGEILSNPLHLASMYTAFSNNGNMLKPYLLYKDDPQSEVWISEAISPENTSLLVNDLISVVNKPEGSGYAAHRDDTTLAGKTGTAELKSEQGTQGHEIGWFSVFTTDANISKPILLVSMVDGVDGKGGSNYVVEKDAAVLDQYLQ